MAAEYIRHKHFPYYREPSKSYWLSVLFAALGILFLVSCKVSWLASCLEGLLVSIATTLGVTQSKVLLGLTAIFSVLTIMGITHWYWRTKNYKRYYHEELKKLQVADIVKVISQCKDHATEQAIIVYLREREENGQEYGAPDHYSQQADEPKDHEESEERLAPASAEEELTDINKDYH